MKIKFDKYQYNYQTNSFIQSVITDFTEEVLKKIDDSNYVSILFINYSDAASGSVVHQRLIEKL